MRPARELIAKLALIEADERLRLPTATIQINAPLALIQLSLATRRDVLRWVLDDEAPPVKTPPAVRHKKKGGR